MGEMKVLYALRLWSIILVCTISIDVSGASQVTEEYAKDFLEKHVNTLSQQIMLQQFFKEQRVRSEGQSGLHLVRQRRSGDKNYFVETHNGYAAGSIHDHANNIRTVGLGQFSAVLNGVEFQTRHNDYRLNMPHRTSGDYNAFEHIPFPDVPPEVLNKPTIEDEIEEMREWFKAWQNEDDSIRDYTKYFKPVLCYLEGGWSRTDPSQDQDTFDHTIDSKVWSDIHQGDETHRDTLPRKIMGFKDGVPQYAQWEYRIMCHPLKQYLSIKKMKLQEDLSSRMMTGANRFKHIFSRAARFSLHRTETGRPTSGRDLLDELMEEIPGKNNYQGLLYDESLDSYAYDDNLQRKDASRYHRWYRTKVADASGMSNVHRGFSDDNFFAALTTQPKTMGLNITKCKDNRRRKDCKFLLQKWTYAIPLEIIYLTPLSKWNPYGLTYHGLHVKGTPATLGGRYGDCVASKKKELNGTNSQRFYQTPDEFFSGKSIFSVDDKADTARPFSCVLDPNGISRRVRASGVYTLLPRIKGLGPVRQRYPIFPVHGEGSSVWKELNALKDIILDLDSHKSLLWNREHSKTLGIARNMELKVAESKSEDVTPHSHYIELSKAEVIQIKGGKEIHKETSLRSGHSHVLRVRWDTEEKHFFYYRCDKQYRCWDRHSKILVNEEDEQNEKMK